MPRWKLSHDPEANPLGCNGKPGKSGYNKHKNAGTKVCRKCRAAFNWWQRERRRKGNVRRILRPCGTYAAYARHKRRNEPVDLACAIAGADYAAERRRIRKLK